MNLQNRLTEHWEKFAIT